MRARRLRQLCAAVTIGLSFGCGGDVGKQGDGRQVVAATPSLDRVFIDILANASYPHIRLDGSRAIVAGKTGLTGASVIASDLRPSASLVVAALVAEGYTIIDRVYDLDRGYEKLEDKLRSVGAQIERLK